MLCILSKFFNFCAQINDALTFNTKVKKTTMITLIGLNKNISPAHFYDDYKLDSNFVSCILSKFSNFCAQINDASTFNTETKKTTMIMLIGLSKNISPAHFYGWTSHLPTTKTKESNEKDYKSKISSPPNAISSSHVSSFSLDLYQLDPHTTLSSSFWISKSKAGFKHNV